MKVFVVVALLVASAAARIVDVDSLNLLKEKSLLRDEQQMLVKEKLFGNQWEKKSLLGDSYYPITEDVASEYGYDYPTFGQSTYGQRRVTILSFEELISTPLFREYYNIPLFRQYLEQYPVVFQKYLESVLFQQFWTHPQFMQYFRNPVLFYKYIVPQVQVIARTHQTVSPFSGEYNKVYNYEQYMNKNLYPEGREVVVGDYLNKIFSGLRHHQGQYESFPYTRYGSFYGNKNTMYNPVNYKFLLDKIYRTLFVNQPTVGEVTQVRTDVNVAPAQKEVVVDQLTGEKKIIIEEPRIVDVKVAEQVIPRTQVGTEFEGERRIVKEVILKKLLKHNVITPEVYEYLMTLPIYEIEQLIRERQGHFRDFVDSPFITRHEILRELETPYTYGRGVYGQETPLTRYHQYGQYGQQYYGQRVNFPVYGQHYGQIYNNEIVDRVPFVPRYWNNVFGQQRRHIVPTYAREQFVPTYAREQFVPTYAREQIVPTYAREQIRL